MQNNIEKQLYEKGMTKDDLQNRDILLSGAVDKINTKGSSCYEIMVHKLCNEKCFFCSQDHASRVTAVKPNDREIYKRILMGVKGGYGMLGFTGGEPLTHPDILKYIRFAAKAGFRLVRIQTNGTMLGQPGFAQKCVKAGATLFKFSIHHYKDEIHDYLVGLPGALKKVKYGIRELKKMGCRMGINIVLTEQNYRDLPDFLLYYLDLGVTSFVIILPLYENSMKDESKKVGFQFSDSIKYIIKSLYIFDKLGLTRPLVLNLPMCLLKGYEDTIIQSFNGTAVLNLDGSKTNIDENKAGGKKRVKICEGCEHNKICFGVDEEYLKIWGEGEFQIKKEKLELNFSLDDLNMKNYFTDNELCLLEILAIENNIGIKKIAEIKEDLQICKDCDDMSKISEVEKSLLKKGYIKIKGEGMNKIYSSSFNSKK